jgi:hypothetical protein
MKMSQKEVAWINEYESFIKIKENIYSQGEGADSPERF